MVSPKITHHASNLLDRRSILKATSLLVPAASVLVSSTGLQGAEESINVFGPRQGYSPQFGPLVSEMTWMRNAVLKSVKGMTQDQLDFLLDNKANTIGALLYHLAAAEKLYQLNTFDGIARGDLPKSGKFNDWEVAMGLGEPARKAIKGHNLDFYLNLLQEGREKTLAEFRKRDDQWLMAVDTTWAWGPTNNYCKWFHVCEHESNHNGQIKLLKNRFPGAKVENG
jgi:uncharacterized damage-inducible protein DinB